MCLCEDGLVGEARSLLNADTAKPDVKRAEQITKEEQQQVVAPSPKPFPFKRKGPTPTPLGHNRVDHHPENAVPKRARTKRELVELRRRQTKMHAETGPTTAT
eukprot:221143-Prorocentrum_minimum.AAC.1